MYNLLEVQYTVEVIRTRFSSLYRLFITFIWCLHRVCICKGSSKRPHAAPATNVRLSNERFREEKTKKHFHINISLTNHIDRFWSLVQFILNLSHGSFTNLYDASTRLKQILYNYIQTLLSNITSRLICFINKF